MNKLILTNDFEKVIEKIKPDEIFLRDELKVEDVNKIKEVAYIKDKKNRKIVIGAKKFNIYSQNALLKLLEESPKGVEFILLSDSKYKLLDTILSRLVIKREFFEKEFVKRDIKISNEIILEFLRSNLQKEEVIEIIKSLLDKAKNSEQLEIINKALLMLELNLDKEAVLSMVMLGLKDKR